MHALRILTPLAAWAMAKHLFSKLGPRSCPHPEVGWIPAGRNSLRCVHAAPALCAASTIMRAVLFGCAGPPWCVHHPGHRVGLQAGLH